MSAFDIINKALFFVDQHNMHTKAVSIALHLAVLWANSGCAATHLEFFCKSVRMG